jgi:hypothetical protein
VELKRLDFGAGGRIDRLNGPGLRCNHAVDSSRYEC